MNERIVDSLQRAESYLKKDNVVSASVRYQDAAHDAAKIMDFRRAATYATKAKNLFLEGARRFKPEYVKLPVDEYVKDVLKDKSENRKLAEIKSRVMYGDYVFGDTSGGERYAKWAEGFRQSYIESAKDLEEYAHAMRHEAARRKVRSKKSLLERLFSAIVTITIASFLGAIYFLSPNITGNVIGVGKIYSNWIGGVLFIP